MKQQINSSTKAHLIRGAFYLVLLTAVCATPFALAQRNVGYQNVTRPLVSAKDHSQRLKFPYSSIRDRQSAHVVPAGVGTPTSTPSASETPSASPSASETPSASPSASETPSASPSASETPSASPSASETPSASPSASETPSASPSASETPSASPSVSPTPSV